MRPPTINPLSQNPQSTSHKCCSECGSFDLIDHNCDVYCADCGAVIDEIVLTSDYAYNAMDSYSANYVPRNNISTSRLNQRWNRASMNEIRKHISHLTAALSISGCAGRAERLFTDFASKIAHLPNSRIYGRAGEIHSAACVYISAIESGSPLTLLNIAVEVRVSVFALGKAEKRILRTLNLKPLYKNPFITVEMTVNRVFGLVNGPRSSNHALLSKLSTPKKSAKLLPRLLLDLISDETLRSKIIEISAHIVQFSHTCSLDQGRSIVSISAAAIVLGIAHSLASSDISPSSRIRSNHRDVISNLVSMVTTVSNRTISKHAHEILVALMSASKTVPWLKDKPLSTDTIFLDIPDILFCYTKTKEWLFSTNNTSDSSSQQPAIYGTNAAKNSGIVDNEKCAVVSSIYSLEKPPSFANAEAVREHRSRVLSLIDSQSSQNQDPADGTIESDLANCKEFKIMMKLHCSGISRDALLSLPLSTLILIDASNRRKGYLDPTRADSPDIGIYDMNEDELQSYLRDIPLANALSLE